MKEAGRLIHFGFIKKINFKFLKLMMAGEQSFSTKGNNLIPSKITSLKKRMEQETKSAAINCGREASKGKGQKVNGKERHAQLHIALGLLPLEYFLFISL